MQGSNPCLFTSTALAGKFFTTSAAWEGPSYTVAVVKGKQSRTQLLSVRGKSFQGRQPSGKCNKSSDHDQRTSFWAMQKSSCFLGASWYKMAFLAPVDFDAVISCFFILCLLLPERVSRVSGFRQETDSLAWSCQRDKDVSMVYKLLCRPEAPFESLLPCTAQQAELPTWIWSSIRTKNTSDLQCIKQFSTVKF